jgi:hypothetical protein
MTDKMPKGWEEKFLFILANLQRDHKAYWVQTKHIQALLFCEPLTRKDRTRYGMRMKRLGDRLIEQGKVEATYLRQRIGKSTGLSLVRYYHYRKI